MTADEVPARYSIHIRDHLDPQWSDWFDGMAIIQQDDGTTTLTGRIIDQAALFGLLARLRDLGATLLAVVRVVDEDAPHGTSM
jgi:hypothetical protein